jgi:uncharacterized protein (UPF0254 family)
MVLRRCIPLALIGLAASAALAQPRPYFYLTDAPAAPTLSEASQIVQSAETDTDTAARIADAVYDKVNAQISAGTTDSGHVCIWLL